VDRNPWRTWLVAALLPLAAAPALGNPLETVDVLCGGTAVEERARLAHEVIAATLSLEFAIAELGADVADVDVLFTPVNAPIEAFGIVAGGPVCLLELPHGEYRIDAWFNGHSRSARAFIAPGSTVPIRVAVEFPEHQGTDALLVPANAQAKVASKP
jgi:hypothetical protein